MESLSQMDAKRFVAQVAKPVAPPSASKLAGAFSISSRRLL